ncbi:MAG TPA: hypothetical protein VN031_00195 [Candidatus Microsaccharimonas sp.]|nr:hypothetical protein [Candidatus Microsaccharimonas sp.]
MSYSPEDRKILEGGERVGPSLESLVEISLPFMEVELVSLNLAMRLDELGVFEHVAPSFVLPKVDKDGQRQLFTARYTGEGANGYHDVRRVVVTHNAPDGLVIARDWMVDLSSGMCAAIESYRHKRELVSARSGPSVLLNMQRSQLLLTEGAEYLNDLPKLVSLSQAEASRFMEDTAVFVGGYTGHLDMKKPSAFTHKLIPGAA